MCSGKTVVFKTVRAGRSNCWKKLSLVYKCWRESHRRDLLCMWVKDRWIKQPTTKLWVFALLSAIFSSDTERKKVSDAGERGGYTSRFGCEDDFWTGTWESVTLFYISINSIAVKRNRSESWRCNFGSYSSLQSVYQQRWCRATV